MSDQCVHEVINSKDVYVIRDHHHALLPWAKVRSKFEVAPALISLDHHTDNRPAYLSHIYHALENSRQDEDANAREELRRSLAQEVDFNNADSVRAAIGRLRHDEHIHAAVLSDIIGFAFVIQLMEHTETESIEERKYREEKYGNGPPWNHAVPEPVPPFTYSVPDNGIFIVPSLCVAWCQKMPHDDECFRLLSDSVIEDRYLGEQLDIAKHMATFCGIQSLTEKPYILDIDLDYFHTRKAVAPIHCDVFSQLIRGAEAITIALEPDCVENLQLDGEKLSSGYLLEHVKGHILRA